MKVVLAREYGFCNGVKRALAQLDKAIAEHPDRNVYVIGEIIHNSQVIRHYESLGVKTLASIWDSKDGIGVVRAHGLPSSMIEEARTKGLEIIDATCPYVRLISRLIKKEIGKGADIFLLGEPDHPEVIAATADFAPHVRVIDHERFDPDSFAWPKDDIVLLSQTTMAEEVFVSVASEFVRHCRRVTVYNTICRSTRDRQRSALEVASQVQAMVVIGGKNSSNTKRLAELCSEKVRTIRIESASEIRASDFQDVETVGVTAGASTPDESVTDVIKVLRSL
jgi:4-hydroxy-3-methylbut-2-enyl diphosphate reductase